MVARSVRKVYDQVKHSALPDLPIHWTEYNAAYDNRVEVTDCLLWDPGWQIRSGYAMAW